MIGEDHVLAGKRFVSTHVWLIAHWNWWIIDVEASSWSLLSVELNALLSGSWACKLWSWDHTSCGLSHLFVISSIQAVSEQAFSTINARLLILDDSAFSNDILVIIELWSLGTDVHFHGDFDSVRVFIVVGDDPIAIFSFSAV